MKLQMATKRTRAVTFKEIDDFNCFQDYTSDILRITNSTKVLICHLPQHKC